MAEKKVRVRNNTTDGTSVRVFVDHLNPTIRAVFDVQPNALQQNNHMTTGHRGVVVYDDFNESVILTGEFVLDNANVQINIGGDAASGYNLSFAIW